MSGQLPLRAFRKILEAYWKNRGSTSEPRRMPVSMVSQKHTFELGKLKTFVSQVSQSASATIAWKAPVLPLNYIRNDEPETSAADYTTSPRGCKRWVQERPFEPGGRKRRQERHQLAYVAPSIRVERVRPNGTNPENLAGGYRLQPSPTASAADVSRAAA